MGLFGRKKKAAAQPADNTVRAMVSGKIIPISAVPDEVFSQKILGDGFGIEPTDELVVAPAAGEITVLMDDSGHACGMKLDSGIEILIHIGVDTVDMKGKGFTQRVKVGDRVAAGDPLIAFDRKVIAEAGHPDVVIFVIADDGGKAYTIDAEGEAAAGETVVITLQ